MTGEPPETATVSCPECGGDVCVLNQIKQSRSHRSRVIPSMLWLLFVLVLIGCWLSIGIWRFANQTADHRLYVGTEFRTQFVPWESKDKSPVFLSSNDMQRAVAGDEDAMRLVHGTLGSIVRVIDTKRGTSGLEGVRFAMKEPDGVIRNSSEYRFGGEWIWISRSAKVQDIRANELLKSSQDMDWNESLSSFFPFFMYAAQSSNTATASTASFAIIVQYLTVLGVLSICMLMAWLVQLIGIRCGARILRNRYTWSTVVLVFFAGSVLFVTFNPELISASSTATSQVSKLTPVFSIDELRECANSEDQASDWCKRVLETIPDDVEEELLLGQLWIFDEAMGKETHEMVFDTNFVEISYQFPLFWWGRASVSPAFAYRDLPERPRLEVLPDLLNEGTVTLQWGPPRESSFLVVNIVNIALVVVSLYWVWAGLHWGSRRILRRVQRCRVRQEQCIFCAYPLTSEARIARNPPQAP